MPLSSTLEVCHFFNTSLFHSILLPASEPMLAFSIVHLLYHEETGKGCEIIPAYIIYEKEARLTNQRASLFL